jgi:hypothetical protein
MDILSYFVDLIDRQRMGADRNRRGGSEHKSRAETVPRPNDIPCERILQMPDCIRGTAGTHKDHVGVKQRFHNLWVIRAVGGILFARSYYIHCGPVVLQASLHKLAHTPDDLRGIQLKAGWSFKERYTKRFVYMSSQ